MRIGIIGGNGFVGSAFVRYMQRNNLNYENIEKESYSNYVGQKFDLLINANGNSKKYIASEDPQREFSETVNSVQNSLIDFKYSLYVHCSTVDVYNNFTDVSLNSENSKINVNTISKYGLHKFLAENLVSNYAPNWLLFRFGGFIGPGLKKNSIYDVINGIPLRVNIKSSYQYLPTDFAPEGVFKIIKLNVRNEIFNFCGKNLISIEEVAKKANKNPIIFYKEKPPLETYNINIQKILKYIDIPETRKSVIEFIKSLNDI